MNVKLTKRVAWELISRIHPRLNIQKEITPPDVAIFKASTGPEGLEIRCENDWFNHNGRIKLTIGNVDGGTPIIRYYHPDTLNRDYVAEQAEKEAEAKQARKEWVWAMGKEMAHKLVDQYWGGYMNCFAARLAGAVHFSHWMNFGSYENTSLICGQSCWIWNTALGIPSKNSIRLTNWKSALPLKKNGWPLAFQSTEPVNLCQHFGNGLKKLDSHKINRRL